MHAAMTTTEIYLIAMAIIFTVPYLIWRLFKTDTPRAKSIWPDSIEFDLRRNSKPSSAKRSWPIRW